MTARLGLNATAVAAVLRDFTRSTARSPAATSGARRLPRRIVLAIHEPRVRCLPVILFVCVSTVRTKCPRGHLAVVHFGSKGALGTAVALTPICVDLKPM